MNPKLETLESGALHRFADWPNDAVPAVAAGAYTVWEGNRLIYAGMAGRSLTVESILVHRQDPSKVTGLRDRLRSHASGRRSGDQFCIYVADKLVLPKLDGREIDEIANGSLLFDSLVRDFVRERLSYRFVEAASGDEARALEREVRDGDLSAGKPVLNPI